MVDSDSDVEKLLALAQACGPDFGAIADRYGLALTSGEPEVVASATLEFDRVFAAALSRSASQNLQSVSEGLEMIACFMRVCRDQERMCALMGGIGHIAASHSRRFGPSGSGGAR